MKKTLLSIFGALAVSSAIGQASASWSVTQNAAWPKVSTGVKLLSAVDANVLWAHGYDGTTGNTGRNYSWFTKTSNGGTSYTSGNIFTSTVTPVIGDTNSFKIASLEGVDANTCWVISYLKAGQNKGAIHKTINGGTSWQNMTPAGMFTNTASFADVIHFLTPQIGVVVGDPHPGIGNEYEIWRTADAGSTWTLVPGANIPNPSTASEYGLTGVSTKFGTSNIWFGTNEGRIYRSSDAGLTWNVSTLNAISSVNEIAFSTALNGYAWVYANNTTLEQYTTTDGGATWTMIAVVDPNLGLNNVCAIPGTSSYASCGAGTANQLISYSQNAGVNWTDWGSTGIQYLTVDFVSNTTGWAGGFSDPTTAGIGGIYKYTGPAITNIVLAINAAPVVCLSGPTATTVLNNVSTGSPTPTYTWTSSSAAAVLSSSTAVSPTITFTANGSYTFTLFASNITGTATTTQVVLVQSCTSPTASFSAPTASLCNNKALTFTNTSSGTPTPTYSWSTSPSASVTIAPSLSATNPTITFANPGVYSVTLLSTNANGTAQVTQTINISNCSPVVSYTLPVGSCTLSAVVPTVSVTGGNGALSYLWTSNPAAGVSFNTSATVLTPTISFANAGTYTVTLKATNLSGSNTAVQSITVSTCVGIQENTNVLNSISVFPNPSNGVINIVTTLSNDNINYSVTNILGSTVSNGKFNSTKSVDLSGQSKGIYFITFESNGSKTTKKIILE
jgi:hypothetical protein